MPGLIDANYAINVAVGDVHFYDDEVKYMQNAAGGEVSWTQWAAGDTKDADGSWRMGVVNSRNSVVNQCNSVLNENKINFFILFEQYNKLTF